MDSSRIINYDFKSLMKKGENSYSLDTNFDKDIFLQKNNLVINTAQKPKTSPLKSRMIKNLKVT